MTDIVDRLRIDRPLNAPGVAALCRDAADEIERLRVALSAAFEKCAKVADAEQEVAEHALVAPCEPMTEVQAYLFEVQADTAADIATRIRLLGEGHSMTDIVERLREYAKDEVDDGGPSDLSVLLNKAADEIQKLRLGWLDQAARDAAEIVRLEVEIERLRADGMDWERMSEKHRAAWVAAAQDRDRMKVACQLMIDGKWDRACKAARAALAEPKP